MKKYLFYAAVIYGAAYAGNRYDATALPQKQPALKYLQHSAAAKQPGIKVQTDSLADLQGIKPAGILLLE